MTLARRAVFTFLVTIAVTFYYPTFRSAPPASSPHAVPVKRYAWELPVEADCKASFERDFVIDPAVLTWTTSFTWMTTECANGNYTAHAIGRDAAGNQTDTSIAVKILNLARQPLLNTVAKTRLFPGGGYLELIVRDPKRRQFGLSLDGDRFAWSMAVQFDVVTIIESGAAVSMRPAPFGSTLRLSIAEGVVSYLRNGTVFYTSTRRLTLPASVEIALEDALTVMGHLTIAGGSQ